MSVRHAMLALLSEGPKYGLQLREEFEARTGEVWPLNVGQVYTTLQRLERDGLVKSDGTGEQGPQKRFRITTGGQQELARWLCTPSDLSSPPRDDLVIKVLVALYVPSADVHAVIQAHRRYLVELMQQWTQIKEYDTAPTGRLLTNHMNVRLISIMGRIAGVTAAQTRERLLRAAADMFAERGYDGTRVADIAAAAGLSNGALYSHFASKAELLVGALRAHGRRLPLRRDPSGYLIVEALVAARRDQDVARPMRDYMGERADWMARLMRVAQADRELDPGLSPDALAHFCLLLAMGSALITPDLHAVGEAEWAGLLTRLVTALAPAGPTTQTGTTQ